MKSTRKILRHLSLEPLWCHRQRNDLIFLCKAIYGLPFLTSCATTIYDPFYRLKNNAMLTGKHRKPRSCTFFTVRYSLLWNTLPIPIRNCDTITKFKRLITLLLDSKESNQLFSELSPTNDTLYYGPPNI